MNRLGHLVYKGIKSHPITALGLFCLAFGLLFTQPTPLEDAPVVGFHPVTPILIGVAGLLVCFFWSFPRKKEMGITLLVTMIALVGYGLTLLLNPVWVTLSVGVVLVLLIAFFWWQSGKLNARRVMALLIALGFLLRLLYAMYTTVNIRQHDVWLFSYFEDFTQFSDYRHAEYIQYIATYLKLPMTDPTAVGLSQIYHPPFHHLLAGLWLRLQWSVGIGRAASFENIQLLTVFYSSAVMILVARIATRLKLSGIAKVLMVAIVCFHPTLLWMAGSVNNDMLSFTLAVYGVFAALRWYQNPKITTILPVALGVGLSMMTKLSGGLVAVGIALLFLWKWFTELAKRSPLGKAIFWQFAVFGVVCVPLALWWPMKNAILYNIPLTYVPALSPLSGQYLGNYTTVQRLFGWEENGWQHLFMAWENQGMFTPYNEYNLILALLKTSVFGEFTLFKPEMGAAYPFAMAAGYGLFLVNVVMIALSLYATVRWLIRDYRKPISWMFLLLMAVPLYSYVQFCFEFPQTCTQNFRYALPALLSGATALGMHFSRASKPFRVVTTVVTALFCVLSATVYLLLGTV